jgi:hypothetical protein
MVLPAAARPTLLGAVICALVCALAAPPAGTAQEVVPFDPVASPLLPAHHWAVLAVRRAEALGLVRQYLPAQTSVPRQLVRTKLREAAARAAGGEAHLLSLTHGWEARFAEEFPAQGGSPTGLTVRNLGSWASAAYAATEGGALPGTGLFAEHLTGAAPAARRTGAQGAASLAVGIGRGVGVLVQPVVSAEGADLQGWEVRTGWRSVGVSLGRQPVGFGYALGGNLVLSGAEPIDRLQVETLEPFRLPGFLCRAGLISATGFASRLDEPRHPGEPYFWGMAGSLQPHPRITLSVHRASIMGGDSVPTPLTPRNFFWTFIGHNLLTFENEVVAGQIRVRLPTERLVPLTLYTEWGAEDAAGAWRDVPGRLYGLWVPALPGLPQVALGAEHVSFAGACCGNPPWYRHHPHTGGWAMREQPFGHPLGGQGRQTSVLAQADLLDARLRLEGHFFGREREGENLYVPGREGASAGWEVRAAARIFTRSDAVVTLVRETGAGWTEQSAVLGLRAYF